MKLFRFFGGILLACSLLTTTTINAETTKNTDEEAAVKALKDPAYIKDISYYVGIKLEKEIERFIENDKAFIEYDRARILEGFTNAYNKTATIDEKVVDEKVNDLLDKLRVTIKIKVKAQAEKQKADGTAFRDTYAQNKDVKKTTSGILYKIIKAGDQKPSAKDNIKVAYTGSFTDGTIFDASPKDKDITFSLDNVITGLREAIQLIGIGGEIEFVLPPELAYGPDGTNGIPPESTLVFKVKLIDIVKK